MELSNLKPAAGSTHNDNFRRGRGLQKRPWTWFRKR